MNNDYGMNGQGYGVLDISHNIGDIGTMYGIMTVPCESYAWEAMQQQSGMNPAYEAVLDALHNGG